MTPELLARQLAACRDEGGGPTPGCPDEQVIAGYVDATLDSPVARELERHLADCSHCLDLVALLSREHQADEAVQAAGRPAPSPAAVVIERRYRWHRIQKWAVAAALVLAVPVLFQMGGAPGPASEGQQEPPPSATTRMATPADRALRVLSPSPGSTVDPDQLAFSWTEVPGSPYYDLRIVTDEGDIVAGQRVAGTRWQPAAPLRLEPGTEYFVLVEAYPSGDKAVSSHHVPFRVPE